MQSSILRQPNGAETPTTIAIDLERQSSTDTVVEKIQSWRHVCGAIALSWKTQKRHLFTSWVHVPLGVTSLLVISWALRLAITQASFRFPAPVIVMLILFFSLVTLDWLSSRYPSPCGTGNGFKERKRFIDPVMAMLAPPCEFCLRNMSVMFTPSFILIPAREMIPGKEIGLLAAWFAITQVLGYVFAVLIAWGVGWAFSRMARQNVDDTANETVAPTLAGLDFEKGVSFQGGRPLSTIATGLSGVTATVIAPVSHISMHLTDDEKRHIESTAMEFARQQGDPAVTCDRHGAHGADGRHHRLHYDAFAPQSDVSSYEHHVHSHQRRRGRPQAPRSLSANRAIPSQARARSTPARADALSTLQRANTSTSVVDARGGHQSVDLPIRPAAAHLTEYTDDSEAGSRASQRQLDPIWTDHGERQNCDSEQREKGPVLSPIPSADVTAVNSRRGSFYDASTRLPRGLDFTTLPAVMHADICPPLRSPITRFAEPDRRLSQRSDTEIGDSDHLEPRGSSSDKSHGEADRDDGDNTIDENSDGDDADEESNDKEDAIASLSSWINDLITPTIYGIIFVVGIPLFFACDIALPLFLAINILTFIAAITIVPPKIRRFAHPILTTSISTVFIIWAFAAMKGIGLKDCLNRFYSVGAKYIKLWAPSGYNGPVPGAGDVLFSTLDAGIVALAVPMYRYRRELRETFVRMCIVLMPCAALSLFFWNYIASLMGLDQIRALAFSARFMSTPLAIELAGNVGADESITVILVVITGVVAAILKEQFFFRLMRVKKDDYLTVGLAMGATSGAIGANSLISTPRTMAIASLSFVIFGTILLVATAIPPIVDVMRSMTA